MIGQKLNLVGLKFNRLFVIQYHGRDKNNKTTWECLCDCGNIHIANGSAIKSGSIKSCGCLNTDKRRERFTKMNTSHGMSKTSVYNTWEQMIKRCNWINGSDYVGYGGRGIKVCERWFNFENFYNDMGDKPSGSSLDRIDNNGNYEPSNCRWRSPSEQARNRRSNRLLTFKGLTKCVSDWADELNIDSVTIRARLDKLGWDVEKALLTPVRR